MLKDNKKPRVVIDTNVYISALNFGGKPYKILELFISGRIEVCTPPFIIFELENILSKRFNWAEERIIRALDIIKAEAIGINPKSNLSIIKEKDSDNRILECAVDADADYIISGDKRHILQFKEYADIKIVSVNEFLRLYDSIII